MKKIYLLSACLFCNLCIWGQKVIDFHVEEFKEVNDTLYVNYQIRIHPKLVPSSQLLDLKAYVCSSDSLLTLPGFTVIGNNKSKTLSRFKKLDSDSYLSNSLDADTLLNYTFQHPYSIWMDSAQLVVEQRLVAYRNHTLVSSYNLSNRIELSPREPYQVKTFVSVIQPQKEEKIRKRQGKAYLDFQVGRSIILPGYRRNPEELSKIDEAIREIVNNSDATLKGIYIEGYASPEGSYSTNERLSAARALSLKDYIQKKFNLTDDLFKVNSVAEDWSGLVTLIQEGSLAHKDKILEIIDKVESLDDREAALKKLAGGIVYRDLLKNVYPELRRVEYQIDYTVKDYDVAQSLALLDKKVEDLSHLELYNLAHSYPQGSEMYNRILLEIIPLHYPQDPIANNNAATVLIHNGELASAKRFLSKAGDAGNVENNKGVVALLENDLEKAAQHLIKAQSLGAVQAVKNLKEMELKAADNKKQERYKNNK